MTRLLGEAPSGMNTDGASHRDLWSKVVSSWQHRELGPRLWRVWRALASERGIDLSDAYIEWAPLSEPTDQEIAQMDEIRSRIDAAYLDRGVYTPSDVARARFVQAPPGRVLLEQEDIDDDDANQLAEAVRRALQEPDASDPNAGADVGSTGMEPGGSVG